MVKTFLRFIFFLGLIGFGISTLSASAKAERVDEQLSILDDSSIYIDLSVVDGDIGVSPDDMVYISYYNSKDIKYEIEQYDDKLTLTQIRQKEDVSFSFFKKNQNLSVLIPKQFKGDLTIKGRAGSMSISDIFARSINVQTRSGFIKAKRLFSAGNITLLMRSGSMNIADIYSASGIVELEAITGSIKLSKLDAQNIIIYLRVGSIRGSIVGNESDFTGESNSKFNNLPEYWGSGSKTLNVSTHNGSVNISFTE